MNNNNSIEKKDERPTAKTTTIPPPLPPFRSVRMNVAPPPAISFGSFGPSKAPTNADALFTGQGPVEMKMAPPKPMGFAPTQHTNTTMASTSNAATTRTQAPANFVWKVHQVSTVPAYHPLERTAVIFSNDEHPLDLITGRISGFMKEHSIFTDYQDDMARVLCSTNSCLHFSVQLWKKDSSSTVMEIQRRQGCSILMQSLRNQLKETILMGPQQANKTHEDTAKCPVYLQKQLVRMVPAIPSSAEGTSCMDICQEMLSSTLQDQNRMGLESLCVLTNASKVQDPQESCEKVLQDESLQSLLISYFAAADSEANLHLLALKAVAQALENAGETAKIDVSSVFWKTVLETQYQHIQRPHERPIEASLSIKSLRFACGRDPEVLNMLQRKHSLPVVMFLQIAQEFGQQHNRTLEQEAKLFMMMKHYVH